MRGEEKYCVFPENCTVLKGASPTVRSHGLLDCGVDKRPRRVTQSPWDLDLRAVGPPCHSDKPGPRPWLPSAAARTTCSQLHARGRASRPDPGPRAHPARPWVSGIERRHQPHAYTS